jgi:putative membrane protein
MLLNATDLKRVEATIAQIEQRSAAEIVVCVVPRADDYAQARACFAMVVTLVVAWTVVVSFPLLALHWVFLGQGVLWVLAYLVAAWSPLLRVLVSLRTRQDALQAHTAQLFVERGLTETRDRSGVLIVIAEAEHLVRVFGDRGIHQHLGDAGWREQLAPLLLAIAEGRAADGVVQLLEALGAHLAEHFPVRPADVNELPDRVLQG